MRLRLRTMLVAGLVLATAGCGFSGTPTASRTPSLGPSASPAEATEPPESPIDLASLTGRIAFSAGAPHAEDVYVVNADGSGLEEVTTDPAADFDPTWSPDGTRLAYRNQPADEETTEIFAIGLDGPAVVNVSRNEDRADWGPAWSPDGSTIAWNTHRPDTDILFTLGLAAPDGTQFRDVEPGVWVEYPAWSPDGRRIAFMAQTPVGTSNYEIWVMNVDGTDPVRLTDSPGSDGWPAWSPDGSQIAFSSVRDDCSVSTSPDCLSTGDISPFHTLWVMNADGSDQHRVSRHFAQLIDWSPDGRYLVIGTFGGLAIVGADGRAYAELPLSLGEPNFPDWIEWDGTCWSGKDPRRGRRCGMSPRPARGRWSMSRRECQYRDPLRPGKDSPMRSALAAAIALAAVLILPAATVAITYGVPDGNGHPEVGALLAPEAYSDGTWATCSGTLISSTVFLTAAHCDQNVSQVAVTFDSSYNSATGTTHWGTWIADPAYRQAQSDPHDLAVVVFDDPVIGITPAQLPTAGSLNGATHLSRFTAVGYGAQSVTVDHGPVFHYADIRYVASGGLNALNKSWLRISMNPSLGNGGTCFGDSGGPNFVGAGASETNVIAATTITGDERCRATNVDYRLDTPSARAFLGAFVTLP